VDRILDYFTGDRPGYQAADHDNGNAEEGVEYRQGSELSSDDRSPEQDEDRATRSRSVTTAKSCRSRKYS
jgi:hypothetical protein